MAELVKTGDHRGVVLAYGTYSSHPFVNDRLYVLTNSDKFFDRADANVDGIIDIRRHVYIPKGENVEMQTHLFGFEFSRDFPRWNLLGGPEYVLFTGDHHQWGDCEAAMHTGLEDYFDRFMIEGKVGKIENWREHKGRIMSSRLSEYFFGPMLEARMKGNADDYLFYEKCLFWYCAGAPFFDDVVEMVEFMRAGELHPRLASAYLDKINAIHQEDYLAAADKRDTIRELLNEMAGTP